MMRESWGHWRGAITFSAASPFEMFSFLIVRLFSVCIWTCVSIDHSADWNSFFSPPWLAPAWWVICMQRLSVVSKASGRISMEHPKDEDSKKKKERRSMRVYPPFFFWSRKVKKKRKKRENSASRKSWWNWSRTTRRTGWVRRPS